MSLTKLLKSPIKLFRKEVITFVSIKRYDLGILDENLSYIATRPSASVSNLRQKIWHLLDLPDFCEEVIILKSPDNVEVPLTELRKGNHPYSPYILEVWKPENRNSVTSIEPNNMLMDKEITNQTQFLSTTVLTDKNGPDKGTEFSYAPRSLPSFYDATRRSAPLSYEQSSIPPAPPLQDNGLTTISHEKMDKSRSAVNNLLCADTKNSEISCRISACSIFRLNGKKSNNFTDILIKIQNDLCHLTSKLDILENKISNDS